MTDPRRKTDAEWKQLLPPEQYAVTRQKGTERAFTGTYYHHAEEGTYLCACCGAELFRSEAKYESGSGWPSFWQPVDGGAIAESADGTFSMARTEITCSRCDAHLGHVFDDGPRPSGLRYCVNSLSLGFRPKT